MTTTVQIKLLDSRAKPPAYHSHLAAGMDLCAFLPDGAITLARGAIATVRCGFAMALPAGFEAQVRPRSGLASRHGITLPNAPGTIDADYRGEVMVPLINLGPEPFTLLDGVRIAQMVIAPVLRAAVELVGDLAPTERGAGGFGSTGI